MKKYILFAIYILSYLFFTACQLDSSELELSNNIDYFSHKKYTATVIENDNHIFWARTDGIYRQNKSSNIIDRICEASNPDNLLFYGDNIFFLDENGKRLLSVHMDGGESVTVFDVTGCNAEMVLSDYQIENDSVYFLWQNTLYSYSINEKKLESLYENINIDSFQIVGEFMYYIDHTPRTFTVYKMNLDTGETSILAGYGKQEPKDSICQDFLWNKDRLLYVQTHPDRFYMLTDCENIILSTGTVTNFYVADESLYYVDFDYESSTLYAYDFEQNKSTAVAELSQFDTNRGFSVIDGYVYYHSGYSVKERYGNLIYDYKDSKVISQQLLSA